MEAAGNGGSAITFEQIIELVRQDKYQYSSHAEGRMAERDITDAQLKATLLGGEVLETYIEDPRGRSYLVLGFPGGQPLHVHVGYNRHRGLVIVVTTYVPEPPRWVTPRQRGG